MKLAVRYIDYSLLAMISTLPVVTLKVTPVHETGPSHSELGHMYRPILHAR